MVPSTVDETRCAVWVVLTETEKGPGSPPPAELLQKHFRLAWILEDFGRQVILLFAGGRCWGSCSSKGQDNRAARESGQQSPQWRHGP
jgi:hypothetical protein